MYALHTKRYCNKNYICTRILLFILIIVIIFYQPHQSYYVPLFFSSLLLLSSPFLLGTTTCDELAWSYCEYICETTSAHIFFLTTLQWLCVINFVSTFILDKRRISSRRNLVLTFDSNTSNYVQHLCKQIF